MNARPADKAPAGLGDTASPSSALLRASDRAAIEAARFAELAIEAGAGLLRESHMERSSELLALSEALFARAVK
jgi:hypothetical protein